MYYVSFIEDKVKYMINHGSVPLLDQDIYEIYITAFEIEMNIQFCFGFCDRIELVRKIKFRACMAELAQVLHLPNTQLVKALKYCPKFFNL